MINLYGKVFEKITKHRGLQLLIILSALIPLYKYPKWLFSWLVNEFNNIKMDTSNIDLSGLLREIVESGILISFLYILISLRKVNKNESETQYEIYLMKRILNELLLNGNTTQKLEQQSKFTKEELKRLGDIITRKPYEN